MKVDGVFAGGGVRALAFVGALNTLEKRGIEFERVAGTSAGAITAAFITSGFTSGEIFDLFEEIDLKQLLDPRRSMFPFPFLRWLTMYRKIGLYKGTEFEKWLVEVLKRKGVSTFGDLPEGSLKMVASDITNGRFVVLPDDLPKYGRIPEKFSVARAIRMSCSIPFFFEPVKIYDGQVKASYIVDGGVLSNFPMWVFKKRNQKRLTRPVLGFRLSPELEETQPRKIKNAMQFTYAMVETMRTAHDQRYISRDLAKDIVFIPVQGVKTTDFALTDDQKNSLIELGENYTETFLKKWSN
ncbi:patatin-like phospholipase family protein [Alteribacter natronophilus]|uniref:patatin-like phospholipase family protein n=1 Tax=Alteribacter natronophilus TaxID=2583810 RepID=UPI00110ED437|nr:patatin-like phospholipase family protein [Alteribacter natronophilus]TMW73767.1 patatin-like phospholipase family protein [Alteribacter natronophilus]